MADVGLDAELVLSIDRALSDVGTLEQALAAATTDVPLTLDTSTIEGSIADAVASATATPAPIEVDPSGIPTAIEDAVSSVDPSVTVDGDTGPLVDGISSAVANIPPIDIPVEADTTAANEQIADLGSTAAESSSSVGELNSSVGELGALAGVAEGSASELVKTVGELGGEGTAVAAGGVLALAGATAGFFEEGLQAVSAGQRFEMILGDMASKIKEIDVNGLNTSVEELGIKFGSTGAEMENVNSKLFQNAVNAGISRDKAVEFAQQIETLSARAISLNPQLGTLADVSSSLGDKLARGGRFAQLYGIQLTASEIATRALADTGKTTASELTIVEKSIAGAELASEKYGATLAGTVAEGSKNAAVQAESLKASFKEAIEQIGVPLVAPILDLLKQAEPDAVAIAKALGELGHDAIPVVSAALAVIGPPLQLVADILDVLPDELVTAVIGAYAFQQVLGAVSTMAIGAEVSLGPLGIAIATVSAAAVLFGVDIFGAGDSADSVRPKIEDAAKSFDDLTKSVHDSIAAEIDAASSSPQFRKYLTDAHVDAEQLNTALGYGAEAWDAFKMKVFDADVATQGNTDNLKRSLHALDELKDITEKSAQATIDKAESDGKLTDAQVKEAESQAGQIDGKTNYASALNILQPQIDAVTVGTDGLTIAEEKEKKSQDEAAQAAKDHADAIQHLEDIMKSALDGTFSAFEAELKLSDARIDAKKRIEDYEKANADGTKTQDELTKSLNDARQAVLDQAQANVALQEAQDKANGKTETATEKQQAYISELQNTASTLDPGNPLRVALDAYIWQIASTPTDKHTDFEVETEDALRKWNDYVTALANGTPYQIETIFNVQTPGPRAKGGSVEAHEAYVVGEVGRELFVPRVPGVIVPNVETERLLASRQAPVTRTGPLVSIGTQVFVTPDPVMAGRENARQLRTLTTDDTVSSRS